MGCFLMLKEDLKEKAGITILWIFHIVKKSHESHPKPTGSYRRRKSRQMAHKYIVYFFFKGSEIP